MDTQQIQTTIITLQRNIRDAQRQLIDMENLSAADYKRISQAQHILNEHMQMLIELKDKVMQFVASPCPQPSIENLPQIEVDKRGRGGVKQFYLIDNTKREDYVAQIQTIFENYYDDDSRWFILPDGTTIKSPFFLACLYDLGIKNGIASIDAPVKDFALIVQEATKNKPSVTTAYNTIQSITKSWRRFVGDRAYYDRTAHLFALNPKDVVPQHAEEYHASKNLMDKIQKELYS